MPLHALLPCTLFTVNLLQLRSLTYTHTRTLHTRSALSCTHALSLSLFLLQQQRSLQGPSQAHILFSFIFPLLYFAFLLRCFTASLSLSLSLSRSYIFLFVTPATRCSRCLMLLLLQCN